MTPSQRVLVGTAFALVLALALPATAMAVPNRVTVHPGPVVTIGDGGDPQEPYYVTVDVHEAAPPSPHYDETRDCSRPTHDESGNVVYPEPPLLSWIPEWRPPEGGSLEGTVPECAWQPLAVEVCPPMPIPCLPVAAAFVAYDTTTGDYVIAAGIGGHGPVAAPRVGAVVSGNSGSGVDFDCAGCPTPP